MNKQKYIYIIMFVLLISLVSASNVFKYSLYDDCQLDLVNINFYNITPSYHFNDTYISYDSGYGNDGSIYSMIRNPTDYIVGVKADINTLSGSSQADSKLCIGNNSQVSNNGNFVYFYNGFCINLYCDILTLYEYVNGVQYNLTSEACSVLNGNFTFELYYLNNNVIVKRNNIIIHNVTDFIFQPDNMNYLFTTRYYSFQYHNYQHVSYVYDILNEPCIENWNPSVQPCVNGVRLLDYKDLNNCGTYDNFPSLLNNTNEYCSVVVINQNQPQPYVLPFIILGFVLILCTVLGFWKPITFFVGALVLAVLGSLSIYYKLDNIIIVLLYFMSIIYIGLAIGLMKMKD